MIGLHYIGSGKFLHSAQLQMIRQLSDKIPRTQQYNFEQLVAGCEKFPFMEFFLIGDKEQNNAIGYIRCLPHKDKLGNMLEVNEINILPLHQNRGVGTAIMNKFLIHVKLNWGHYKLNYIYLDVESGQDWLIKFYQRFGFNIWESRYNETFSKNYLRMGLEWK